MKSVADGHEDVPMIYRLEVWSVVAAVSHAYMAPELAKLSLHGRVFGHPRHDDGTEVTTSYIEKAEGTMVLTHSGSIYQLGVPSAAYVHYLDAIGYVFNPAAPVKVRQS